MKTKTCSKCKKEKNLDDFSPHKLAKDGKASNCKECHRIISARWKKENPEKVKSQSLKYRKEHRKEAVVCSRRYYKENREKCNKTTVASRRKKETGITREYYDSKFAEQHGCCAICGKHQSELKKALSGDHCHAKNKPRGLLCGRCNVELGFYEKFLVDEILVEKFKKYLNVYEGD